MKKRYIAQNLLYLRIKKGKTIKDVSKETGLSQSTLDDIENDVSIRNSINTIVIICNYFNVKVDDFVYKNLKKLSKE